jgi:Uma2 family endonuclease
MNRRTLLTADELEQMPDDDSVQVELDEGELIIMPPAGPGHGSVEVRIARIIANYVEEHDLGEVYSGDTGFRLNDMVVRAPDVAFVRKERIEAIASEGFARGAPDLAVEILSPSNKPGQLERKIAQYFAAGCQTVWIVNRKQRTVEVLGLDGARRLLGSGDTITAPELLPGFAIQVAKLFQR